jgi:hypothetical protein
MKNVKLIDALPTISGVIAIVGALTATNVGVWAETNLSPMMLYWGGGFSLVSGLISVVNAMRSRKFGGIHIVNIGWVVFSILFFIWTAIVFYGFRNHPWTF